MNTHLSTIATSLDWSVRYSNGFGFWDLLFPFLFEHLLANCLSIFEIILLEIQTQIWVKRYSTLLFFV